MLINILIGLLLGFLSGMGIGGGSLLILWLTLVTNTPTEIARSINLMFFLTAAGSVSILRIKKGSLKIKTVLPAAISGCLAAGLCSWLGKQIDPTLLQKFFGALLLITGLRELFYRPKKAK